MSNELSAQQKVQVSKLIGAFKIKEAIDLFGIDNIVSLSKKHDISGYFLKKTKSGTNNPQYRAIYNVENHLISLGNFKLVDKEDESVYKIKKFSEQEKTELLEKIADKDSDDLNTNEQNQLFSLFFDKNLFV